MSVSLMQYLYTCTLCATCFSCFLSLHLPNATAELFLSCTSHEQQQPIRMGSSYQQLLINEINGLHLNGYVTG